MRPGPRSGEETNKAPNASGPKVRRRHGYMANNVAPEHHAPTTLCPQTMKKLGACTPSATIVSQNG